MSFYMRPWTIHTETHSIARNDDSKHIAQRPFTAQSLYYEIHTINFSPHSTLCHFNTQSHVEFIVNDSVFRFLMCRCICARSCTTTYTNLNCAGTIFYSNLLTDCLYVRYRYTLPIQAAAERKS